MTKISRITAGKTTCSVFLRADLMLELPAPFQVHALRQLHLLLHQALGFLDEADDVAVADVQLHVGPQHAVFALDHGGAFDDPHVGDHRQAGFARATPVLRSPRAAGRGAHACSPRRVAHRGAAGADQQVLHLFLVFAPRPGVADAARGIARGLRRSR